MPVTLTNLKKFCKLAKIDCSSYDTKDTLKRKVNKYLKKYKYAPRYLRGLSPGEKFTKMFEMRFYKLKEKHGLVSSKHKYSPSSIDIKYSSYKKKK
jgi:hypothetical protein